MALPPTYGVTGLPTSRSLDYSRTQLSRVNWRGPSLPMVRNENGYFTSRKLRDLLHSSVFTILTTSIGSRMMRRTFGSKVPSLVFEPNDDILSSLVREYTVEAIGLWEPRIEITGIDTTIDEHTFTISLRYFVHATNEAVSQFVAYSRNIPMLSHSL